MPPFQFLFGQTPETINPMHVDACEQGQGEWDSKTINIGYDDTQCFAEIKAFTTSGFLQDFDEWKRIAYLMRAAPDLLQALQELVHKCLHTDGYSQKVDELYNAQQAINKALGTDKTV